MLYINYILAAIVTPNDCLWRWLRWFNRNIDSYIKRIVQKKRMIPKNWNTFEDNVDGAIDMTTEEIRVCENQSENLTSIITNMSGMIDAERQDDVL